MIGLSLLSTGHPPSFQPRWVRPSTGSYPRFSLAADRSPGFASTECDSLAILKTRFRCGSLQSLTSPRIVTRWLILQKARRHTVRCSGRLRARGFRYCFTPLAGCFSPFPHGTRSLSVSKECLALADGPACFAQGFTCPALLGMPQCSSSRYPYGAVTLYGRPFQAAPVPHSRMSCGPTTPRGP